MSLRKGKSKTIRPVAKSRDYIFAAVIGTATFLVLAIALVVMVTSGNLFADIALFGSLAIAISISFVTGFILFGLVLILVASIQNKIYVKREDNFIKEDVKLKMGYAKYIPKDEAKIAKEEIERQKAEVAKQENKIYSSIRVSNKRDKLKKGLD